MMTRSVEKVVVEKTKEEFGTSYEFNEILTAAYRGNNSHMGVSTGLFLRKNSEAHMYSIMMTANPCLDRRLPLSLLAPTPLCSGNPRLRTALTLMHLLTARARSLLACKLSSSTAISW